MFFKKYKMQIEQLQQENESLRAQIAGLAFNLKTADDKVKQYEMQLENLYKQNRDLSAEVNHLNMLAMTSNYNKNDSRNY
jgi:septal ring factor EnvC (AmiA/AmiB activator)